MGVTKKIVCKKKGIGQVTGSFFMHKRKEKEQ
jgi:hypothetical protein